VLPYSPATRGGAAAIVDWRRFGGLRIEDARQRKEENTLHQSADAGVTRRLA
jgi:hypothetical protein